MKQGNGGRWAGEVPGHQKKRAGWRSGPFTAVAIVVGVLLVYSQATRRDGPELGRPVYEADANGRMRRVSTPSPPAAPQKASPPLWKPEVSLLLARAGELRLTAAQRTALSDMDAAWAREKHDLGRRMEGAVGEAQALAQRAGPQSRAPLSLMQGSLGGYSELSTLYDRRRAWHWGRAVAVLNADQGRALERLRQAGALIGRGAQ